MSQDNKENKYRQFDSVLREAYMAFLAHEEEDGGPHRSPAVRAARFNEFVCRNFRVLAHSITPDICETYLSRFRHITASTDQEPEEPLDPAKRYAQGCVAYAAFRSEVGFKGSREAEILAFHQYVTMKYPKSLPDFTEEEARTAITGWKNKRHKTYATWFLGIVLALGVGSIFYSCEQQPPRNPINNLRKPKDWDGQWRAPEIGPLDDGPQWRGPVIGPPGNDPLLPGLGNRDDLNRWQKEWLKRLEDDQKKKEPGK